MTTTTTAHRANTGLVFYSGGDQENALQAIDAVMIDSEGRLIGLYSGKTQEQLQVESGLEIRLAGAQTFAEMRDVYYTTAPSEITESAYIEALEVLPPMRWGRWLGVESFRLSEFYCGNVTSIYARTPDGRYWTFRDNAYMDGADIARKAMAASAAAPKQQH